ncbi:hypothetical protein GQ53DRAFT_790787 [Thozetella sp. PMI_491]|nr:hypothetical protein GQ53DRAFT_790787 [Thozetella sp. PMI_491]
MVPNETSAASDHVFASQPLASMPTPSVPFHLQAPSEGLEPDGLSSKVTRSQNTSPLRLPMPYVTPGQLAFSALQFLPVPLLVLDSLKTVVLANEAMGRLLGLISDSTLDSEPMIKVMNRLRGQSLSQVGIDMIQDGHLVWIEWEQFLDQLACDMETDKAKRAENSPKSAATATDSRAADAAADRAIPSPGTHHPSTNATIDVIVSQVDINRTTLDSRVRSQVASFQSQAKMIINVFEVEGNQTYFTLTFTHSESASAPIANPKRTIAKSTIVEVADGKSISNSPNLPSLGSSHDSTPSAPSSSSRISPSAVSLSASPFPPLGPPSKTSRSSTPSVLQKIITMKDALLDNTETPILAMWKDGSVTFPNKAARRLFNRQIDFSEPVDGFDLLPSWTMWTEDFSRQLEPNEYPLSVLIHTESPFVGRRCGMQDQDGQRKVFDVLGEAIRDEVTGEFLAGVITCQDVTKMTEEIFQMRAHDEERFKLICDTMPQLVWTATPDGMHDFFNDRWYNYTGLSKEESLGLGWKSPFHPDDVPTANQRWQRSLETGEPYVTEYRCRSKEGDWRWFLGRALPLKDKHTGKVEKWFGTCTDVHESVEAKLEAKRTRQQLLSVIAHSHVTIFTVNLHRKVTMLEGALIWDAACESNASRWYIGEDVYSVFNRLNSDLPSGQKPQFLEPMESVLKGRSPEGLQEHRIEGKWYRTRFLPILGKQNQGGRAMGNGIEGAIGVIMDITQLKAREADLKLKDRETKQLVENEAAAKERSRLKSQFLANMSHEIRTPITGVIGMSELLLDLPLTEEQREYTENIYRSGNALLTVINDILDLSKVESGRLDVEEVQFSLSVVVRDVNKMLSFAAERKGLNFLSDVSPDIENNLVVLGDPGRVRQIITNLLTNSIKFTNQGDVKFTVEKEAETADTMEIKFVVEDTGIGIEEGVRKRLFQPFSQGDASTARKFGGTGLGLAISQNLLELMHGRMTLDSTLGIGTTATFWIPFTKSHNPTTNLVQIDPLPDRLQSEMSVSCNSSEYDQALTTPPIDGATVPLDQSRIPRRKVSTSLPASSLPEAELPLPERGGIHVLVVEDNAINQQIATKTIQKLGFPVTAVWDGKEALEYLTAAKNGKKKKPDIILMDVQMPVIDGYKCTHLLRRHHPYKTYVGDIPIVAMTASAIQGDKEKCQKAGMDDYLAKPVKGPLLERMLVRWSLRKRAHNSASNSASNSTSDASDCSETSEHCEYADLPGSVELALAPPEKLASSAEEVDPRNLPTPRPRDLAVEQSSHFPGYTAPSQLDSDADLGHVQSVRHIGADEMAMQSRDDKLIDAAGGAASHSLASPLPIGEALTEENVGRLEVEALFQHTQK